MFPFSIRNLFFTWVSLRPWVQSLIKGIPWWPLVPVICLFGWGAQALPSEWYGVLLTSLFIVMWYGAVWAMGQNDIRHLTFKSGRVWFIAAIVLFLAGMAPVPISLTLLVAGGYLVYDWDRIIAAKKLRFVSLATSVIILALVLNGIFPGKFALSDLAWALPLLVVLIAPKQVDKFVSWVYSAIVFGVAAFVAMGALADKVPEDKRPVLFSAIALIAVAVIIWMRYSSKAKLMRAAHEEKKAAAANSATTRKLRRWMFIVVISLFAVLHSIIVIDMHGETAGAWPVGLVSLAFVYAMIHRLNEYDRHHIAASQS